MSLYSQLETMDDFFKADGLQKIMFFFQENESSAPEAGRND